jgi:acyl transferase domain-containing protein/NAD(P)-dependent dehydrogenase (short-subunit alcohol dehydrogenase family)/acyl carrier protein
LNKSATPLAIVGIGCLFPKANGLGAYWSLLKNGTDAITPVPPTHWNPSDYFDADPKKLDFTYAQRGAFLDPYPFPPGEFGIAPNDLEATDTSQLLALVAARMALEDAGYGELGARSSESGTENGEFRVPNSELRVSVIIGVTSALELVIPLGARLGHPRWRKAMKDAGLPDAAIEDAIQRIGDSYPNWQESSFPGLLGNVVAGRIANRLDLHGTNCVVDAACASSLSALHLAALELSAGRSDMVVTGGVDTFSDIFMYMCFSKTPALSPTGDARPFSANADGTILGEGLGIIILKRLADAERDGDRIYAVLRGLGSSSDGRGNAIYAPTVAGQVRALEDAYRQAGISPATVELVEAHGTGTKVGDATEIEALTKVFVASRERERPELMNSQSTPVADAPSSPEQWCALGSVKAQIGHTKAAAGAAGLIKAILALYHKVLPPTIKVEQPAALLADGDTPFYVNTVKRPWMPRPEHRRRAAVSAFGFGGSNFHCVLEEYKPQKPAVDWDGDVQIAALSADSFDQLHSALDKWDNVTDWDIVCHKSAESRESFSPGAPFRLLMVVHKGGPAISKLVASARLLLQQHASAPFAHSLDGVYFGQGISGGKLGVLFPGQGSQYVGMLRDLACQFPAMQETLAEANEIYTKTNLRLSDLIYPTPAFSPDAKARQEKALRATQVAQPAIGAVSLGAWRMLEMFGVKADAAAGHSFGELTALCAAGAYDSSAFHRLSGLRGQLMAAAGNGDAGAMLAVHAAERIVEPILKGEFNDVIVANRNSPQQVVLSGSTREIERAAQILSERGIRTTRLPVSAAFHSSLVAEAEQPFREALTGLTFDSPRLPVFANATGRPYPADIDSVKGVLAGQLARPVEFVQEIEQMIQAGVGTFFEVGPGSALTRLVEAIVKESHSHEALDSFPLDASTGKRSGIVDLAHCLARLAAHGHEVRLPAWEEDPAHASAKPQSGKGGFTVPICGANYMKPRTKRPPAAPLAEPQPRLQNIPLPEKPRPNPVRAVSEPAKSPPAINPLLQVTQEGLAAFQKLQQQTADLHRHFLQGQEAAQQALQRLIEQQQQLILASTGARPAAFPAPSLLPAPNVAPPPPVRIVPPDPIKPAVASAANDSSKISDTLLQVVAEKTGYPSEMLSLDMGLDADLGIDSIKRVEILSALQERLPEAPSVKPEHLGTLNTLRQIATFLANGTASPAHSPVNGSVERPVVAPAPVEQNNPSQNDIPRILLDVVAEKTGYPADMLNLEMGLDADLGIDSIKRVEILSTLQERLPHAPAVKPEHLGTLTTLAQVAAYLANGSGDPGEKKKQSHPQLDDRADALISRQALRAAPMPSEPARPGVLLGADSVIWLIADGEPLTGQVVAGLKARSIAVERLGWDVEVPPNLPDNLTGLVLLAPKTSLPPDLLLRGMRWLRECGPTLRRRGRQGGALFRTVSRLDGAFGLQSMSVDSQPDSGGLAGLAKVAHHEWPEVNCRALDLAPGWDGAAAAAALCEELLHHGPVEVGLSERGAVFLTLEQQPVAGIAPELLKPGDAIVITGGARGVTAEVAVALAQIYRCTLVLLGRTPIPEPEPAWLSVLNTEAEIKQAIASRGTALSPKEVGKSFQAIAAAREIRNTLAHIAAAGARAVYHSLDVRDAGAIAESFQEIRAECGPITGIIHGAGIIEDRVIEEKTDESFLRVLSTKVDGIQNLLGAATNDPLKLLVLFSSSTARFGRKGQVDYAVANEVLNKTAQCEAKRRPECRVVSINWGPWEGGMVTPAHAEIFRTDGIGLIPVRAGAQFLLAELAANDDLVEVITSVRPQERRKADYAMPAPAAPALVHVFEREVSAAAMPILDAHVIGGRLVLPLALHLEWLAHAALHGNPGMHFVGCNDLRVLNGFVLEPGEARILHALAGPARKEGDLFIVPVELRGTKATREVACSRAEVVIANRLRPGRSAITPGNLQSYPYAIDEAYERLLFHEEELQGIVAVDGLSDRAIVARAKAAPPPGRWLQRPVRNTWLADPLVLDCAFQLSILWSAAHNGLPSLPTYIGRYRQFESAYPSEETRIVAQFKSGPERIIRAEIEFLDDAGTLVARIERAEFVSDAALVEKFKRRQDHVPI